MSTQAPLAVVLTSRDRGRHVKQALDSLRHPGPTTADVRVVDLGSTEAFTRHYLASLSPLGIEVVFTPDASAAAGWNAAIENLTASRILVWPDELSAVPSGLLEWCAATCADAAIEFIVLHPAQTDTGGPRTVAAATAAGLLARTSQPFAFMFSRALWQRVGGFDERLPGLADVDFLTTAVALGASGRVGDIPGVRTGDVRCGPSHHASLFRLIEKHVERVGSLAPDLTRDRSDFLGALRARRADLERRRDRLAEERNEIGTTLRELRARLRARGQPAVEYGDLGRVTPFSPLWGVERGRPVDRFYIERFLEAHRGDIHGRVIEIKDHGYAHRLGGDRVTDYAVLDNNPTNPQATVVADLSKADAIESNQFDCFILVQTLQYIFDVHGALAHAIRILKPGGVLLCTVPALSRIDFEAGIDADYWRFTEASLRAGLLELLPPDHVEISSHGNVLAGTAFLYGLTSDDLAPDDLAHADPWFPLIFTVRARKPDGPASAITSPPDPRAAPAIASRHQPATSGVILMYHRVATPAPDIDGLAVRPEHFRAHMDVVKRRYQPMALEALVEAARFGEIPEGAVTITFDDGYLDNLTTASPILVDAGLPATFFIVTGNLNEPREYWWDVAARIFLGEAPLPVSLDLFGDGTWLRSTATERDRLETHQAVNALLRPGSITGRNDILARITRWSGLDLSPRQTHRPLVADEVRELAARPLHAIGAHSVRHLWLPAQPTDVQLAEIVESRQTLEHLLERAVPTFAYPYGAVDRTTRDLVGAAGFTCAVTTRNDRVRTGADRLMLPRLEIRDSDAETFDRFVGAAMDRSRD